MSGEGPESIPTSADPRSHRPTKKRALTPVSAQAASLDALFARPDQEIRVGPGGRSGGNRSAAVPEIVTNVQGSSAGAGSGEFHVYKAARRREYERLREMDEEVRQEKEREVFDREKEERLKRDEERTRKNREKREKMKARKAKKGKGGGGGGGGGNNNSNNKNTANGHHSGEDDGNSGTGKQVPGKNGDARETSAPKIAPRKENGADRDEDTSKHAAETTSAAAQPAGLVIHDDD